MKKLALVLSFVAAVAALGAPSARAEIGTVDQVPAATLLLPYFEVDYLNANASGTTITINNASATAQLAHVTLWTDEAIPTFTFDVYLTGYDVQQVNLNSLFASGTLPITGDVGSDPGDTISPMGNLSQDINFPGMGPACDGTYSTPALTQAELRHIRAAHTGKRSDILNGCAGAQYGDNVARGYVTIDVAGECTLLNPASPGYFAVASDSNTLWGDYTVTNAAQNFEWGGSLVHVESCDAPIAVGNGAGYCPFAPGDYTFYGRYVAFAATDQREPLATTFAVRYANGGPDSSNTNVAVWRDTKKAPTGSSGKHKCSAKPAWFPLAQTDVVAFDHEENPVDLCFLTDNVSPPIGGPQTCFPLATQRAAVESGTPLGAPIDVPFSAGWLFLNLNHAVSGDPVPGVAQAWVEVAQTEQGRFAVGHAALPLDNATTTSAGGVILIP